MLVGKVSDAACKMVAVVSRVIAAVLGSMRRETGLHIGFLGHPGIAY